MKISTNHVLSTSGNKRLEESFHWLFLTMRMDVDISRLLARALAEQLQLIIRLSLFWHWT